MIDPSPFGSAPADTTARTILSALSHIVLALVLAACGDAETDSGEEGSGGSGSSGGDAVCDTTDAAGDLLAEICDQGVLTVSTDPAYPPQSKYNPK